MDNIEVVWEGERKLPKPSKKWRKHAEVYKYFAREYKGLDFSEEAARKAFDFESNGVRHDISNNGYSVGKKWANIQVDEWKAGIADGLFLTEEFLEDPELASIRWWIESVLPHDEQSEFLELKNFVIKNGLVPNIKELLTTNGV